MDFFINIFNVILYQPLFNALILLYEFLPGGDFGLAIIVLTIVIKLILYPSSVQAIKSQKAMSVLQPQIQKIKDKYKENKEKQAKATMELYKENKVNPLSGCLPLLIQLPILIAMYRVFWKGLAPEQMGHLYSFVQNPGVIDFTFLGLMSLAHPSAFLAVLAGAVQFVQSKMLISKNKKKGGKGKDQMGQFADMMQKQMIYFFPAIIVFILWSLPSALALYLIVSSVFSIVQQYFVLGKKTSVQVNI